jgi:peptidoglycan hydrolase-like protein with peptidoglycan-binding domain
MGRCARPCWITRADRACRCGIEGTSGADGRRSLSLDAVNDSALTPAVGPNSRGAAVLRAQVLLDRARFSPGEIDAAFGSNLQKAIAAFQRSNGLEATGTIDEADLERAQSRQCAGADAVQDQEADVAGPFVAIPADMMEKSKLPALGI